MHLHFVAPIFYLANSQGMVRKNAKGMIRPSKNYRLRKHSGSRIVKRNLTGLLKNVNDGARQAQTSPG